MHTIVVVENLSLDGVMQSPASREEDPRDGFDLGGWAGPMLADDPEASMAAMTYGPPPVAMLFGRRTYHQLVGHWLTTPEPNPFTQVLTDATKYVVSRNADEVLPYPNSVLLAGEAADRVAALKAEGEGDITVLGSGELVRGLAAAGLVDRYLLTVLPIVLGRGTRLFGPAYADLELEESRSFRSGAVFAAYRVRRGSGRSL